MKKYKIIELPEMVGKTLEEVKKYLDENPITPNVWQSLKLR